MATAGILVAAPSSGASLLGSGGLNLPGRTASVGGGSVGGVVSGLVGSVSQAVGGAVGGVVGSVGSSLPAVTGDPTAGYAPTLDDPGNPHGEGTVADVTLGAGVIPGVPGGATGGQVVVGQTLGEYQTATQQFHGHITLLSLFGQEILSVDTLPGQSVSGVLGTQQNTLDQICAASMNTICLKVLDEDSTTTTTSSTNHFEAAGLGVGPLATADAAYSDGDISVNPVTGCETTSGDSHVGDLSVLGLTVQAVDSQSGSTSCNNPASDPVTPTSSQSQVTALGGSALAVPIVAPAGCSSGGPAAFNNPTSGTPNTDAGIPTLLPVVCNADDTDGTQASIPYTAREALTAFVLSLTPGSGLAKVTVGASQASSTAPGAIGTTTGTPSTTGTTGTTTGSTTGTTTGSTGSTTGTTATPTTATTPTATATPGVTTTAPSTNTTGTTGANTTGTATGNSTGAPSTTGSTGATPSSGSTATAAVPKAAATLPFTGFNVLWLLVGGMTMLVSGLTLRRLASRRVR